MDTVPYYPYMNHTSTIYSPIIYPSFMGKKKTSRNPRVPAAESFPPPSPDPPRRRWSCPGRRAARRPGLAAPATASGLRQGPVGRSSRSDPRGLQWKWWNGIFLRDSNGILCGFNGIWWKLNKTVFWLEVLLKGIWLELNQQPLEYHGNGMEIQYDLRSGSSA